MRNLKNVHKLLTALSFMTVLFAGGTFTAPAVSANPLTLFSVACDPTAGRGALPRVIFVPWYEYLEGERVAGKCTPTLKSGGTDNLPRAATRILVAVIELLLRISGLVAIGFLIWGAIQYITSQGEPNGLTNAKSTIANAIIGFIIIVLATGIVQFIGNSIK